MAFGFIKKVFSFGKKEVEERPAEGEAPAEALTSTPTPEITPETPSQPEPGKPAEVPPEPEPAQPQEPAQPTEPSPAPEIPEPPQPEIPEPAPETPPEVPEPPREVPQPVPEQPPSPAPEIPQAPEPSRSPAPPEVPAPTVEGGGFPAPLAPEEAPAPVSPRPGFVEAQAEIAGEPDQASTLAEDLRQGRVTIARTVERKAEEAPAPTPEEPRRPWFQRLREGLSRSSRELRDNIAGIFLKRKLDEDTLQDLEDVLLRADLGLETAMRVTDALSAGRYGKDVSGAEVQAIMAEEIEKVLTPVALPLELDLSHKPHVILVVGVNGTGKTTTIGKLAAKLGQGGLKVMLAAGDTFRAAAIEQLKIWGERTGAPVVSSKLGADAAGLAYDAYEKAKAAGSDVLIIDTAGRLQNKTELMSELEKIVRVLGKHDPEAPHTVLQTLDATTGQNALNQVEIFRNVAGVSGLVMTKLDGTARGGILVAIAAKHKLPVYFIGVGEGIDDLEPFSAGDFAKAIAGVS
ncbi:signal recognition particle-docking protein FtsY [Chelativorans sp. AA-79]|uniref:signal recognition particle-docking protein FtsY n=1 Tax=Chelativorans sp. AA-79 TaxID=3028735 RepID=UPI0023F7BB25|nr:signal recognition particle-docking protein FtsY [Chelativorans sp. AA-79]WEX09888.1 signal recognition particle-docking protein FtsY [Chelativorans sp. AA-79]